MALSSEEEETTHGRFSTIRSGETRGCEPTWRVKKIDFIYLLTLPMPDTHICICGNITHNPQLYLLNMFLYRHLGVAP